MSSDNMEITYENLKRIIEKIPISIDRQVIHEESDFSLVNDPLLYIKLHGREYCIRIIDSPANKAFGFPSINGSGTICIHFDAPVKDQRSWILHELAELELSVLGISRKDAHDTAKEYENKYINDE